jgi:hypothetical protein
VDSGGSPRIPPALWLSLALVLAFPPLWNALAPHHLDEPITLALTPPQPENPLALPPDRIDARPLPDAHEPGAPSRSFGFELDRAGRYSVYGISSHVTSAPVVLRIDGERVSTRAFAAETGSRHRDPARRRIATGVELARGDHRVELEGQHLAVRSFALELRREAPLGPARYLALAAAAGLLLAVRRRLARGRLAPGPRLIATATFATLPTLLALLAIAIVDGSALITLVRGELAKRARLAEFESRLESLEARSDGSRFSVAVLGDSTHYWSLPPERTMQPSIERALRPEPRQRIRIHGVAAQAFTAFDYYLLLNRMVEDPPDLVVIPVNVRSFGDSWIASAEHAYAASERYLRFDELAAAPDVRLGARELGWERVLIRRLDEALAGGRISLLLRGLRRHLGADLELAAERSLPAWLLRAQPSPDEPPVWPRAIGPDHPMLAYFRAINRLAARYGVEILYYTVQCNLEALSERGIQIDLRGLYASVEREIAGAPGVHFLDLSAHNPRWMFSDTADHLNERGMRLVAGRLADRIAELSRRERRR